MQKGIQRNPIMVIVLSIITCGIYALYWIYQVSSELKFYLEREDINPGLDLLLCIICVPYVIYWSYKLGKLIFDAQERSGQRPNDNSVLFLILAIFGLSIVTMAIAQSDLNQIWD